MRLGISEFIVPSLLIWILATIVAVLDFVHIQKMIYVFDMLESIGLTMFLVGFSVRSLAKRTLGNYFLNGINTLRRHKLVKNGIYRYIRHPIYLGAILLHLGSFLLFSSPYGSLVMLGYIPIVLYKIRIEEKMLVEKFGKEYRDYMKRTWKIIPLIY